MRFIKHLLFWDIFLGAFAEDPQDKGKAMHLGIARNMPAEASDTAGISEDRLFF
jgi:hypothetical protein